MTSICMFFIRLFYFIFQFSNILNSFFYSNNQPNEYEQFLQHTYNIFLRGLEREEYKQENELTVCDKVKFWRISVPMKGILHIAIFLTRFYISSCYCEELKRIENKCLWIDIFLSRYFQSLVLDQIIFILKYCSYIYKYKTVIVIILLWV